MKIKVLLFVLLASLGMSSAANAVTYRLDATSNFPGSFGDFIVTYEDDDNDGLFSLNELVTFSGFQYFDGNIFIGSDSLLFVPKIAGIADSVGVFWRFSTDTFDTTFVLTQWNYSVSEVSSVPVPAALPLFGTGLAVLGLVGWRRKRKVSALA